MAWSDCKARLAVVLAAVNITSPITETVRRVYSNPPGTVVDLPCFIIYPPAVNIERNYGHRDKQYIVRCRLLVRDADLDQAAAIVDAYREATIDAMDEDTTLNGNAESALLDRVDEAGSFSYGDRAYTGIDCFVTIRLHDNKTFGA